MRTRVAGEAALTRLLPAVAAALGVWLGGVWPGTPAARADGYYVSVHYGYPYWHRWHYPYYRPYWGYYDWPPPAYYGPPPAAYYMPPPAVYYAPPREPYCVQDQVYRYLPDGRIQWGTRTRCY